MSRVRKAALWTLWITGAFIVLAAIVVFYAMAFVSGFWLRTNDQSALKAIKAESQILMASQPTKTKDYSDVPKSRWPPTIASLKPAWVTVYPGHGVQIQTTPFFDGGLFGDAKGEVHGRFGGKTDGQPRGGEAVKKQFRFWSGPSVPPKPIRQWKLKHKWLGH